jgi:arylsulfatase A-like enzyme
MTRQRPWLAALPAAALLVPLAACRARPTDVVLVIIDTLRADHLSVYGYREDVSPRIAAFARTATVFDNAISQAPHTIPSVLQIMTSRYIPTWDIRPGDATLAEVLHGRGYQTAAVVDNANFEISRTAHGLMRGFDRFYRNGPLHRDSLELQHWKTKTPGDCITAQATRWLKTRDRGRPVFLWLHYFDPHDPYMPPFADDMEQLTWANPSRLSGDIRRTTLFRTDGEPVGELTPADRQHLIDLYDAEVRYADQALGEFLDFLKQQGSYDDALIVLTADHGESFGEHDLWTHGHSLYDPEIHVPLIVKFPGQTRGERVQHAAQAIDVFPTVLDALGVPSTTFGLEGTSLRKPGARVAFAFHGSWSAARTDAWKLVRSGERTELFHLADDPGELRDRSADNPGVVQQLVAAREATLRAARLSAGKVDELSTETIERLRALGYVQ